MTQPVIPEDAAYTIARRLSLHPWFKGCAIVGIGTDAVLELRTTSLQDAERFIDDIGGRWSGYPVKARKVAT